jgi:hypothetical protein
MEHAEVSGRPELLEGLPPDLTSHLRTAACIDATMRFVEQTTVTSAPSRAVELANPKGVRQWLFSLQIQEDPL